MDELADVVSDVILGTQYKSIEICGKFYTVLSPNIIVLARMLKPLSKVAVGETEESLKIVQKRIEQSKYVDEAIAIAIMGDVPMNIKNRFRKRKILIELSHSTESQQKKNFEAVVSLLGGKDFFDTARLAMEIAGMMAKQEPSEETR